MRYTGTLDSCKMWALQSAPLYQCDKFMILIQNIIDINSSLIQPMITNGFMDNLTSEYTATRS